MNHGLVHYYFGPNETCWCTRWTGSPARYHPAARAVRRRPAVRRQVAHGDALPDQRGRQLPEDPAWSGRRWPGTTLIRARLARVNAERRAVPTEAFDQPRRELGITLPLEGRGPR